MAISDTTFLIDVMIKEPSALEMLDSLIERNEPLWIPAPALHELYYGAGISRRPRKEVERIQRLEHGVPPVPFNPQAARKAGAMEAELEKKGRRPSRVDVQIAAIAIAREEPLITRDKKLSKIKSLQVLEY